MTKKGGHTGALLPGESGSQLHFYFSVSCILVQLNPQAALLPNPNSIYKLTGEIPLLSKFPSHERSKAECRATHAPRTSVLCTDGHIQQFFVWYPPQNRLRKLSNLKQFVFEITFTNYLTKIFFYQWQKIITALQPTIIIIQSWGKIFTCSLVQTDNCDYCTRLWDLRLKLRCSLHMHPVLL